MSMSCGFLADASVASPPRPPGAGSPMGARDLYLALQAGTAHPGAARDFLHAQIAAVQDIPVDMPDRPESILDWTKARAAAVGAEYKAYLGARKQGAPRRYFGGRSHALYFLRAVAPTKLVDGAWLYGMLRHWDKPDFHPLIRTYLEELGDGVPDKNHVSLYRKLLANHGCDDWHGLEECHFVQGAIQLALACNADRFLPEVIGYNLGYEQLPLHLLVSAYELNELGIDPYYFTLHVTVDNADCGHAHKAVQTLIQLMPRAGDRAAFWRRVLDGYRLNELGAGATAVIAGFDLQAELVRMLAAKSATGKNMHSDYCRVAGRTVNEWLSEPGQAPAFLAALQDAGWIKRGEDPEHSRFWRLVHGERAQMFGVFSAYEQQLLRDWIGTAPDGRAAARGVRMPGFHVRRRRLDNPAVQPERGLIRRHARDTELDSELRELEQRVAAAAGKQEAMALLARFMDPATHHSAAGLMATRMYARLLDA